MITRPDRRHVARLTIPSQLGSPGLEDQQVRLVDLSPDGACIEHPRPFADWDLCFMDLPPALGGIRLQGEVVWSQVRGRKLGPKGARQICHQSSRTFILLTPAQQDALTAALQRLRAAREE